MRVRRGVRLTDDILKEGPADAEVLHSAAVPDRLTLLPKWHAVASLSSCTFVSVTTEFLPLGLLKDIAEGWRQGRRCRPDRHNSIAGSCIRRAGADRPGVAIAAGAFMGAVVVNHSGSRDVRSKVRSLVMLRI